MRANRLPGVLALPYRAGAQWAVHAHLNAAQGKASGLLTPPLHEPGEW